MAYFDRFDICAAHLAIETDWNVGGIVWERPSNARRRMSTGFQLHRMRYRPAPTSSGAFCALSRNGRAIYIELTRRYGFRPRRT